MLTGEGAFVFLSQELRHFNFSSVTDVNSFDVFKTKIFNETLETLFVDFWIIKNEYLNSTGEKCTRSGVRTHAGMPPLELKSNALTTRPSWLTSAKKVTNLIRHSRSGSAQGQSFLVRGWSLSVTLNCGWSELAYVFGLAGQWLFDSGRPLVCHEGSTAVQYGPTFSLCPSHAKKKHLGIRLLNSGTHGICQTLERIRLIDVSRDFWAF